MITNTPESNIQSAYVLRGTSGCEQAYIEEDKVGKEKGN